VTTRVTPRSIRIFLVASVVGCAVLVVGGSLVANPRLALVVSTAPTTGTDGEELLALPISEGEPFELRFTHSVNHFEVHDILKAEPGGRLMAHAQYVNGDGAGIGEVPGEGRFVAVGNGWQRLEGLARELPDPLVVRVGRVADHRLVVSAREHPLRELADGGDRVAIATRRLSVVQWIAAHGSQRRAAPSTARVTDTLARTTGDMGGDA
jgi:hypothetical protein